MHDEHDPQTSPDDPLGLESLWRLVECSSSSVNSDLLVGMSIGGVEIVRMIAEGGMGRVYEGVQQSPRRRVAVKVLRPGPLARATVRRFLQEAHFLGQLHHPWICQVHAAGSFEFSGAPLPYFIMELIDDGLPITEYVDRHSLSWADRLRLFARVCDAIAHAHAQGVIHRDLKPGNIVVDSSGDPRIIDFGIARGETVAAELTAVSMTGTGQLLGTIQYMSPEQVDGGDATVDARTDVYALGLILHEMLTGELPYDLAGMSLLEAVHVIRESRPSLLRGVAGGYADVALVIDRCLEKAPRRRYPDGAALAADLRRYSAPGRLGLVDRGRLVIRRVQHPSRRGVVAAVVVTAVSLLALLAYAVGKGSASDSRASVLALGRHSPPAVVPPLSAATLSFRHSFTSVLDPEADRHLVSSRNVLKWNDPREDLRVNYWGPATNDVEGELVYRFQLPGRTARISIATESQCWDFERHHGGFGRGVSAVEASRDGRRWITLKDDIGERRWGASWALQGDLPDDLLGTTELWLKVRLLTVDAKPAAGYTVAQFARAVPGSDRAVFAIEADCVPPAEDIP